MDYNSLSLKMHEENKGKVEVISKVKVKDRDDLSTAYTPGVAEPCRLRFLLWKEKLSCLKNLAE